MSDHPGEKRYRLTPTMVSGKLLTLKFIRDYLAEHPIGPSLGEIAAATETSKRRAQDRVKALARDGLITRRAGHRGIGLPGHTVGDTNTTLPPIVQIDHIPPGERGHPQSNI